MPDPITNDLTISVSGAVDFTGTVNVTAIVSLVPPTPEPTPPPDPTPPTDKLRAVIDYEGRAYIFDEIAGTDLGDYHEPGGNFVQGCIVVTHPDIVGFAVHFRPDRGGIPRDEVVFSLGLIFDCVPANMGSYIATIGRGSTTLAVIEAKAHNWNARWRWQSWPRPIIYPAETFRGSLLPAYDESLFGSAIPLSSPRNYAGPMDLAGITAYIPSTGERDEIGPCTEAQAEYLCTGSDASWASVQAQVEGAGSIPLHFRDENTNAPLDWVKYPNATMYSPSGANPFIQNPAGSPVTLDSAHMGSFCFMPFLLTGDPYALEWVQYCALYNVVCLSPGARANFSLGNAVRAVAWSLRSLVQAATVTPDSVPGWFLPRSIFKSRLDDERAWFLDRYVNGTTKPCADLWILQTPDGSPGSATSTPPANTYVSVWQEDFLSTILGWVVAMGHSDWNPVLEWKAQDTIARTGGASGWVRAVPTMYQTMLREGPSGPSVTTWADAWALNERCMGDVCAYDDPHRLSSNANITYTSYTLGAVAMTAQAGVAGAQGSYDWLLSELQAGTTASRYIRRKWAIAAPSASN